MNKKKETVPSTGKKYKKRATSSSSVITDLEKIFAAAFEAGNFQAALKAKELQIRESVSKCDQIPFWEKIKDLPDQELDSLIAYLEEANASFSSSTGPK